jgi:hypothetical protein
MGFREQVTVWPMAVLMLAMGIATPLWMGPIDDTVSRLVPAQTRASAGRRVTPLAGVAERQ